MSQIADTLGVSRSQLYARASGKSKVRGCYSKADDQWLVPHIRQLVDARPTYGYRRITALLNKQLDEPVNHKRVYRIMRQHQLLLARKYQTRPDYAHTGKVMVMRSNLRWCSDGFELHCWNGEVIRVVFVLDCFDREVMAWKAVVDAGISSEDVQDMLLEAVEKRFGTYQTPHPIEMLSDNGSAYTARQTQRFIRQLGLKPCFTPVNSPQSNGMAEAFVKTFKRDYANINPMQNAEQTIGLIGNWFNDYNQNHPHSALKMMSFTVYFTGSVRRNERMCCVASYRMNHQARSHDA